MCHKSSPLHPIHLTPDKEGNLPPSALVPFCSYQGESMILGRELPEMDYLTVCDKFQPVILEGKLCHSLDIAKLTKSPTKSGKSNGLLLWLDPYPYQLNHTHENAVWPKKSDQNFKIFIHTLAQFNMVGSGTYAMSTLKKMTGTKNFKKLPEGQKKCMVHDREVCQTHKYLEQVQKECKCLPWALQTNQVEI